MADAATEATATGASEGHEEHHPTPRDYIEVAAALAVLTGLEFSTYFIDFGPLSVPLLLVLMTIKFALIVGFFMHLKYDTRLYSRLLLLGLAGALVLYGVAAFAMFEVPGLAL
jgi:cytochrome c oxidase subunit 4